MSTLVFQVLTLLLGAFLAGCVTGSSGRGLYALVRQAKVTPSGAEGANGADASGANSMPEDRGDDLTCIDGIDSALAEWLNELGLRRFNQIAEWRDAEIDWIEAQLGERGRVRREDWVEQARRLTGGDSRPSE